MARRRKLLLAAGLGLGVAIALWYYGDDHQRYLAWSAQRDAWHRKCDAYIDTKEMTAPARACSEELRQMMAYAKRQGWDR
jgi:nicotinamide riboside kinase